MLFIEATLLPSGHHDVILTGQLGAVMQESARAAVSHIRSQALEIGVPASTTTICVRAGQARSRKTGRLPA